jgi:hypothetical protein
MSFLAVILLSVASSCSAVYGQTLSHNTDHHTLQLEGVNQKPVCTYDSSSIAVILSFGLSCSQCHTVLEEAIQVLDSSLPIIVGVRSESRNSIDRRTSIQWVQKLVKTRQIFLVHPNPLNPSCAFFVPGDIGVHSPCLILLESGKWKATVPYAIMFDPADSSMPSPSKVADRIIKYLYP